MKNKPVVIGIIILFLCVIGFDQYSKYIIRQDVDVKNKQYEETLQHVDSTMILVDDKIKKLKNPEKIIDTSMIKKVDSLTYVLENQEVQYQYIDKIEYVELAHHVEVADAMVVEPIMAYKDTTFYNYIYLDSIIYNYDTIQGIYIDTILITDPKIVNKIKKKYLY